MKKAVILLIFALLLVIQTQPLAQAQTIVNNVCPCATWPDSNCVETNPSISYTMDDPKPNAGGYGDYGTSTITFNLAGTYTYGCYANGYDVWVLDSGSGVVIQSMTPTEILGSPSGRGDRHGWDVDPDDASQHFDPGDNCGHLGASEINPAGTFTTNPESLPYTAMAATLGRPISISKMESFITNHNGRASTGNGPCTKYGVTLTVVPSIPENNGATAFRPPWAGTEKPTFSTNGLPWNKIPDLDSSGAPTTNGGGTDIWLDYGDFLNYCRSTSYDWNSDFGPGFIYPHFNGHEYGVDNQAKYVNCPLTAFLTYWNDGASQGTVSDKEKALLIASIQQGIDLYYHLKTGPKPTPDNNHRIGWHAGAGFSSSRIMPFAVAAVMLESQTQEIKNAMLDRYTTSIGSFPAGNEFGEDGHIWVGQNDAVLWGEALSGEALDFPGSHGGWTAQQYWDGIPYTSGNELNSRDPAGYIDGNIRTVSDDPGSYLLCCSTSAYIAAATTAYVMPELADILMARNDESKKLFDYVERYMNHGFWTLPDPCDTDGNCNSPPGSPRAAQNHGVHQANVYHGNSLAHWIYGQYKDCLRTGTTNAAGQPALNEITASCTGQVSNTCADDGDCPADDVCNDYYCDTDNTCKVNYTTTSCDNGLFCDGTDTCQSGSCVHEFPAGDLNCSGDTPVCNESSQSCVGCTSNSDCDDSKECTADTCPDGTCIFTNITQGIACSGGFCDGSGNCVECTQPSDCDDSNDCTTDTCSSGTCSNIEPSCGPSDSCCPTGCTPANDPDCTACITSSMDEWQNTPITSQNDTFTVQFDATPNVANINALTMLSKGEGSVFDDYAILVRFNDNGVIDAINGESGYTSDTTIPYTAGTSYHFSLEIDIPSHTYNISVKPESGSEQAIGTGYGFRTSQNTVDSLDNWGIWTGLGSPGTHEVCNFRTGSFHRADTDKDGCIDMDEIGVFINRWYASTQDVSMVELVRALETWKAPCQPI
jgi:hypothetical protein